MIVSKVERTLYSNDHTPSETRLEWPDPISDLIGKSIQLISNDGKCFISGVCHFASKSYIEITLTPTQSISLATNEVQLVSVNPEFKCTDANIILNEAEAAVIVQLIKIQSTYDGPALIMHRLGCLLEEIFGRKFENKWVGVDGTEHKNIVTFDDTHEQYKLLRHKLHTAHMSIARTDDQTIPIKVCDLKLEDNG